MKLFQTFLLLSTLTANILANETTIVADRPGFSTGTYTVQANKLNVEMGYNNAFDTELNSANTQTLPLLVLRTGISSDIELDIFWDGYNIESSPTQDSVTSLSIGGKYRLYKSDLYNLTFMGMFSFPDSETSFTLENISPIMSLLWDYTISEDISLFGTLQSSTYMQNDTRIYDAQIALGASFSHTDKLGSFIEVYTIIPSDTQIDTESVFDGGFTYLLNDNIQLDINMGLGLNNTSQNFLGAGIAIQF